MSQQLSHQDKWAAQMLAMGQPLALIAEETGITSATLKRRAETPLFQAEIERWRTQLFRSSRDKLLHRLNQLQEPALEEMGGLLQADSEAVRFNAAKDLLNRGPLAASSGSNQGASSGGATIHLDQQALTAIISSAMNIGNHAIVAAFASIPTTENHEDQDFDSADRGFIAGIDEVHT